MKGTEKNPTPDFTPIKKPAPGVVIQPMPVKGGEDISRLVQLDIIERADRGRKKYGTPLQAHNGRDALVDAYQEALDFCMYLRQAIAERDQ